MREALGSLTTRGRTFLAGGLTTVLCAILVGQPGLVRVGVLVTALPLLAAVLMARAHYQLALTREVRPTSVMAGQTATVELALTNAGRAPTGFLLLEDTLPFALGTRPRFVVEGIGRGWERRVSYRVRSDLRGRFEIGPMTVRVSDPFGLIELSRAFRTVTPLIVMPHTWPLPQIPLGGARAGAGENRPRAFAVGSAEDVSVREYRIGDDLRRVHWRSSARTGDLMVRREEQPWQSRATIFLDNRASAHRGRGAASSLESAVSAAASLAQHLVERKYNVRLVTAGGDLTAVGWHQHAGSQEVARLLESLAVVELVDAQQLDPTWLGEAGVGSLTVALLGAVQHSDRAFLRRMASHATPALAMVFDVARWGGEPEPSTAPALVSALGWRTVRMEPGTQVAQAWQELGRARSARGSDPATPGEVTR